MKRFVFWLAKKFGIVSEVHQLGYEWSWRARVANPDAEHSSVTYSRPDPRGQAM